MVIITSREDGCSSRTAAEDALLRLASMVMEVSCRRSRFEAWLMRVCVDDDDAPGGHKILVEMHVLVALGVRWWLPVWQLGVWSPLEMDADWELVLFPRQICYP